jgi:hypothetical protein
VVGGCDPDDGLIRADWDFTTGQRSQKVHMKREGGLYGGYVGWRGREWGTVRERREKKEGMWILSFSHKGTSLRQSMNQSSLCASHDLPTPWWPAFPTSPS